MNNIKQASPIKISIVTPNYNGAAFLEETIQSVLGQGYPNLEYIIIDGGSTDNSVEIIKRYEKHLAYWISEPDNGMYDAIKKGFEKSTGEIMAWINSDDIYHNKALFSVAEIFTKFSFIDWLLGIPTMFDEQGRTVDVRPFKKWSKYDYYLGEYKWIQQESIFWRRSLWKKVCNNFTTDLKYAGDLALWLSFFKHSSLYSVRFLIGGFRLRSSNQLSLENILEYVSEAEELISKELISEEDQKILLGYKKRIKAANCLNKLLKIKINWITESYKMKYFNYPKEIYFNRMSQEFEYES